MKPLTQVEREFYTANGITGNNVSQMRREFYISQLGAAAKGPVSQMERDWLQKYATSTAIENHDLWVAAANTRTNIAPANKSTDQIKYEFYIQGAL